MPFIGAGLWTGGFCHYPRLSPIINTLFIDLAISFIDLFDIIAQNVGLDWTYLARKLGTKLVRVNSIKEENRGSTREQAVEMLREWRQRLGGEAKLKVIIDALRNMKLSEAADSILRESRASEHSEKSTEHSEESQ